jgi:hypothetical protein
MLTLPASVRIYVAAEAVDLRRGFDGLAATVPVTSQRPARPRSRRCAVEETKYSPYFSSLLGPARPLTRTSHGLCAWPASRLGHRAHAGTRRGRRTGYARALRV